jgi:vacuolar iron transporter family protein
VRWGRARSDGYLIRSATTGVALLALAGSGALAAVLGGANPYRGVVRVTVGGGVAMAATALIGWLAGGTGW